MTNSEKFELLELRKQYQDGHIAIIGYFWSSLRIIATMILTLITVQSGFLIWLQVQSKGNPSLFIIPIGIFTLCGIGYWNTRKDYRSLMEYMTCFAKVEDDLGIKRKKNNVDQREFFKKDEYFIPGRWIKGRTIKKKWFKEDEEFETADDFVDYNMRRWTSMFGVAKVMFFVLAVVGIAISYISYTVFISA